ncbi:MAG: cytidylate kinase [Epulopiscium sp. Nuni2H_MBin003]|nr:MAG: cytidylate kinase [Epulopiscium sp. Nuni2H_MBin003]
MSVAIDGPAGAGKSTIAKEVAKKLGWIYIDTGAMYRVVAFYCIENNIDLNNEIKVTEEMENICINLSQINEVQHIFLNERDVTDEIRTAKISNGASLVATYSAVREKLVSLQRILAKRENVIMDGRDIGTVVLPNAELKIFLTASSCERANRRFKEQMQKGIEQPYAEVLEEINKRDELDYKREVSPLKKADDAIEIDTTGYPSNMVVDLVLKKLNEIDKSSK